MEYLKCPVCGKETPSILSRCKHCGERLQNVAAEPEIVVAPKLRNGFISFYLWFGIVVNSLIGIVYFVTIFTSKGLWTAYDPMSSRIYGFASSFILVAGYFSLLKWKKFGFYVLAAMAVLSLGINLVTGTNADLGTFGPIVSLMILFAVLQLKKNGKSCWEQLS